MRTALPASMAFMAILAIALATGVNPISNNDIWLHLTTGRLILERLEIPRLDDYSFTRAGAPYVAHEWLAQVVFHLVFRAFGVTGLILLKPIALGATAALVGQSCRVLGGGAVASFWAAVLAMAAMTSHLYTRPHLFTFALLAAAALLLARRRAGRRVSIAPLAILQVLWANLHGGFFLGVALAAAQGVWIAAGVTAVASLLNPYGPGLYRFVLLFAEPIFRQRIREWAGPFDPPFLGSFHFGIYALVLSLALASLAHHARRGRLGAAVTLGVFAALSLASKRNASVLGVVAAPWIGLAASETCAARPAVSRWTMLGGRHRALVASCLVALLLATAATVHGVPHETGRPRQPGLGIAPNVPVSALDYVTSRGLEGNVLNSFAFGSYITWRAWPASRVFIDSRLDVFGGPFVEQYGLAMTDPVRLRDLLGRYRVDYALLSYRLDDVEGPVSAFAADGGWALVYYDDLAMVYVRRDPRWAALVATDEYRRTNPYLFITGRSSAGDDPAGALAEARRALSVSPSSLVARLMEATALQAAGRHAEAVASLEEVDGRIGAEVEGRAILLGLLGTSYLAMGDASRARRTFERLLELAPDSAYARKMLETARPGPPGRE